MTKTLNDINLKDLQKKPKEKVIYIRITEKVSKWMAQNKISPSKLFNEAAEVIMNNNGSPTKLNSRKE